MVKESLESKQRLIESLQKLLMRAENDCFQLRENLNQMNNLAADQLIEIWRLQDSENRNDKVVLFLFFLLVISLMINWALVMSWIVG